MADITVKTIKGFTNLGVYARRGSSITVDEFRARDLLRNGLIEDYELKEAPAPQNKQAPKPENKAAGKPKPEPAKKAE